MLICTEIFSKNGIFLDGKLTRLRLPRYLKTQSFALLASGQFEVANVGSILDANQQACSKSNFSDIG